MKNFHKLLVNFIIAGPLEAGITKTLTDKLATSAGEASKKMGKCFPCNDAPRGKFILAASSLNYWSPSVGSMNSLYMIDANPMKFTGQEKWYFGELHTKLKDYSLWYMWYLGDF